MSTYKYLNLAKGREMANKAGHGTDIAFGENTPAPLTDGTAFGWSDGGESENSSIGWPGTQGLGGNNPNPVEFQDNAE